MDDEPVEESLDDEGDSSRDPPRVLELWPCHALPFAVLQSAQVDGIGAGMAGVVWTGISAREVRAALAIHRVPLAERADVAEDVQYMGGEIASERNRRAAAEAKRKG